MGYAEDMGRAVKPVDQRVEEATAPLKEGVSGLNDKLDKLCESVAALASVVDKLSSAHKDSSDLLLVTAKTLGFEPSK